MTTKIKLQDSAITVPAELRGIQKRLLFTNKFALAANEIIVSSTFESLSSKSVSVLLSTSNAGKLYVQESEDQTNWYNTYSTDVSAYTTTNIAGTTYYSTSTYTASVTAKYMRLVYVGNASSTTRFLYSAYLL